MTWNYLNYFTVLLSDVVTQVAVGSLYELDDGSSLDVPATDTPSLHYDPQQIIPVNSDV